MAGFLATVLVVGACDDDPNDLDSNAAGLADATSDVTCTVVVAAVDAALHAFRRGQLPDGAEEGCGFALAVWAAADARMTLRVLDENLVERMNDVNLPQLSQPLVATIPGATSSTLPPEAFDRLIAAIEDASTSGP